MYCLCFFLSLVHSLLVKAVTTQGILGFAIHRLHLHETLKAMQQVESIFVRE